MARVTDSDPRTGSRIRSRNTHCECRACKRPLHSGDVVYRRRYRAKHWNGFSHGRIGAFCKECAGDQRAYVDPEPCEVCGILVANTKDDFVYLREHITCSEGCQNRIGSQERREARLAARADRICESCGMTFTPPRSDGRYCSNACRQDAYRHRKAGRNPARAGAKRKRGVKKGEDNNG